MKHISILGSGWLGTPLAENLIKKGYQVKGSTTTLAKMNILEEHLIKPYHINLYEDNIQFLDPFIGNADLLIITIPPIRGEVHPTYSDNFKKLIPYIHKHNIKNVIMMSSVSVYAPQKEEIIEENNIFSNESTAIQIREAEDVLLNEANINTCILRLGGLFSEDRKPVDYIVRKELLDNPELPINMIHLDDIIAFSSAIIEQGFTGNTIYNIVSPKYKNRFDYYNQEANKHGLTLPPLGDNNSAFYKKINGNKITEAAKLSYKF
ncbi:NAD(P)H-binding protein [Myroides sp. M-43]|uniref:NAD(P)H-binding protein n=1 Tax=Myroides oncorhynchi TaxID=2893756 RepID=UPI001E651256|nr:NAD(P)H-binding protein [Myroides oncorhynchi]MCC9042242.1 NAD(P)H-binding protein [Myroides oncorhynchi]